MNKMHAFFYILKEQTVPDFVKKIAFGIVKFIDFVNSPINSYLMPVNICLTNDKSKIYVDLSHLIIY